MKNETKMELETRNTDNLGIICRVCLVGTIMHNYEYQTFKCSICNQDYELMPVSR